MRKVESELNAKSSREPTDEEIAEVAQLSVYEVIELREYDPLAGEPRPAGR